MQPVHQSIQNVQTQPSDASGFDMEIKDEWIQRRNHTIAIKERGGGKVHSEFNKSELRGVAYL